MAKGAVFSAPDVRSIYQLPREFHDQGLDVYMVGRLNLPVKSADLSGWDQVVQAQKDHSATVHIAMVGKYVDHKDAYKSLNEALIHAGIHTNTQVKITTFDSEKLEQKDAGILAKYDAILVPGGFGKRGVEGKIKAVAFARETQVPFLGICLGMQVALIDFARHVGQLNDANSSEFNADTPYPVVGLIEEWLDEKGQVQYRDAQVDLGGTMRLGGQICQLEKGSLAHKIYGDDLIKERHRHRYEVNGQFVEQLESAGLKVSGRSQDGLLVEVVELPSHPWFIGCQFHPEFTSTVRGGHPLFSSFIKAARHHQQQKGISK